MLTIRRAGIEDLDDVILLRLEFLRDVHSKEPAPEDSVVEATHRYVSEKLPSGEYVTWFAEEDGQIVGTGAVLFWRRPPTLTCKTDLHAYVVGMYTRPEHRGKGVATLILRHIIDHVKTTSARRITLHATEIGRSVYEKLGFVACDNEMKLAIG